jgi:hypothetical protein
VVVEEATCATVAAVDVGTALTSVGLLHAAAVIDATSATCHEHRTLKPGPVSHQRHRIVPSTIDVGVPVVI